MFVAGALGHLAVGLSIVFILSYALFLFLLRLLRDAIESSPSSAIVLPWLLFVDLFLEPVCDLCYSSVFTFMYMLICSHFSLLPHCILSIFCVLSYCVFFFFCFVFVMLLTLLLRL